MVYFISVLDLNFISLLYAQEGLSIIADFQIENSSETEVQQRRQLQVQHQQHLNELRDRNEVCVSFAFSYYSHHISWLQNKLVVVAPHYLFPFRIPNKGQLCASKVQNKLVLKISEFYILAEKGHRWKIKTFLNSEASVAFSNSLM